MDLEVLSEIEVWNFRGMTLLRNGVGVEVVSTC